MISYACLLFVPFSASGGHLHVLQYLRLHGCPWNIRVTDAASHSGHEDVFEWLRTNRCPVAFANTGAREDIIINCTMYIF